MVVFFDSFPASTRLANSRGLRHALRVLQFQTPTHDGVATEARDFDQALDTTPAPLERQQTDEPPPISLVKRGQYPVDRPMVFGYGAIRVLPTLVTGTDMT